MKSHLSQSSYDTGLACLLWLLAPLLGLFIGASIIHSLDLESRHIILANAGLSVCVLLALSVFATWFFRLTLNEEGIRGCTFPDVGLSIIVAALMIPLMGFVSLGVRQLLYNESVNPQVEMVRLEGASSGELALMFVFIGIAIPIMEEVFYRGVCFAWIARRHGNQVAIVLSALIFGCVHVDVPIVVGTFLMGLACGWLRVRSNSLIPAVCVHGINNSLVYALMIAGDVT